MVYFVSGLVSIIETYVVETEHAVEVEALQAMLLEVDKEVTGRLLSWCMICP